MSGVNVHIFRESIARIVHALTNSNIRVRQQGMKAYVDYDSKGMPIEVTLPSIPDNASMDLLNAIQGFLDHEVGHVLFTDFGYAFRKAAEYRREKGQKVARAMQALWNICEDVYIEREMTKKFTGSLVNIDNIRRFMVGKMLKEQFAQLLAKDPSPRDVISFLMPSAIRASAGHKPFDEFMADKWVFFDEFGPKIQALGPQFANSKSTQESWELAKKLYDILTEGNDGNSESEDGEGDGNGQGNAKPGSKSQKNKSKQKQSGNESDGESEADSKESPDSDEASGSGKQKVKRNKTEQKDDGDDSESESSGGEKEESEQNENEEQDGEEEQPESGNEEEDGEDEKEGDEEESGSDGDGESEQEDEEESEEGDGANGEDENEESDEESESSKTGDGDAEAPDETPEGTDPEEPFDAEVNRDPSGGFNMSEVDDEDEEEDVVNLELLKPLDEWAAEAIERDILEFVNANPRDYMPFTRDHDYVGPLPVQDQIQSISIGSSPVAKSAEQMCHVIQSEVERVFKARSAVRWNPGQRKGKMHQAALYRLRTGDDRIFRTRIEGQSRDVAVELVIDMSGSMYGPKISFAATAAYMLSTVLDKLNLPHEIVGFTTMGPSTVQHLGNSKEWNRLSKEVDQAREDLYYNRTNPHRKGNYARYEPICLYVLKDFTKRFDDHAKKTLCVLPATFGLMLNNVDGESVEMVAMRLRARREARKIMIVMSDGQPAADGDRFMQYSKLKQVIDDLEKSGIEVYGLGLLDYAVQSYYKKNEVITNAEEIPSKVIALVQRLLTS